MTDDLDPDAAAADYLFGQMSEAEASAFERRMAGDAALAGLVERWRHVLAELDMTASPLPAGAALWERIDLGLAAPSASREARKATAGPGPLQRLWDSLPVWRGVGLAGAAACLALVVATGALLQQPPGEVRLVAVLVADGDTTPGAVVEIDASGRGRLLPLAEIPVPEGRALEIWTLPDPQTGPVSVGLIDRARQVGLDIGTLPPAVEGQLFEITIEPATGSPTGRPTGPIVYKGLTTEAL
ncbi:anti-sigma factor [Methylobrevis pamukkalensis]|uniref:Anti-sigma-K factor rskA n=1 Tax=Methylobrevis pamukkalensis TaxID=1439726 RepID=A0A1E3H644_9HYPH|nr:anti-sigma factor [Methylobrevis pamukkalensis]ODN71783.1 Anti-sigma-K factor rskA [Methylobrevis pamukkalensis]